MWSPFDNLLMLLTLNCQPSQFHLIQHSWYFFTPDFFQLIFLQDNCFMHVCLYTGCVCQVCLCLAGIPGVSAQWEMNSGDEWYAAGGSANMLWRTSGTLYDWLCKVAEAVNLFRSYYSNIHYFRTVEHKCSHNMVSTVTVFQLTSLIVHSLN